MNIFKEIIKDRSKNAYTTLKTLTQISKPKASVTEDFDGNLLTKNDAIFSS
ncbi:hypothetical protein DPMN_060423 [Dreissena polymorpha]|uniref:Uncharacterized protein n=1 Tax=Dreissena polymorpha TaxID=45954 RepID=A0A9D4C5V5_DREPO|nr:hypothetical protein DPMN_060423 [Dreissena polymorpha]